MPEDITDYPHDRHLDLQDPLDTGEIQEGDDIERFWRVGEGFEEVQITVEPPAASLELLEQLGTSPFERGGFPLIGFLATTYDKVSRDALERG